MLQHGNRRGEQGQGQGQGPGGGNRGESKLVQFLQPAWNRWFVTPSLPCLRYCAGAAFKLTISWPACEHSEEAARGCMLCMCGRSKACARQPMQSQRTKHCRHCSSMPACGSGSPCATAASSQPTAHSPQPSRHPKSCLDVDASIGLHRQQQLGGHVLVQLSQPLLVGRAACVAPMCCCECLVLHSRSEGRADEVVP